MMLPQLEIQAGFASSQKPKPCAAKAFTLIELSIVLVIIGLIVGGILVGQDLIKAAQLRSVITQIEKLRTAVQTFSGKYDGNLPGDMFSRDAARFGLWSNCTWAGCGVNNGDPDAHYVANNDRVIYMGDSQAQTLGGECSGECSIFWRQLSETHLIEGSYGADLDTAGEAQTKNAAGNFILPLYMPATTIPNTYVAVASLHYSGTYNSLRGFTENAFYFIQQGNGTSGSFLASMTPSDASKIDNKIDDGRPGTGSVLMEDYGQASTSTAYFNPTPASGYCVSGTTQGSPATFAAGVYNTSLATGGNVVSCLPVFVIK